MVLRYPNGQPYYKNASPVEKIQEKRNQITEFGNRGMRFEEAINESNKYYLSRRLAVIHKKPTPAKKRIQKNESIPKRILINNPFLCVPEDFPEPLPEFFFTLFLGVGCFCRLELLVCSFAILAFSFNR